MSSEKFSSENTIEAYTRDLSLLCKFFDDSLDALPTLDTSKEGEGIISNQYYSCNHSKYIENLILNCDKDTITSFICWLHDNNKGSSSIARTLSCVRRFFKFLMTEKLISYDPTSYVDSPKTKRPLPKTIDEKSILELIEFSYQDESKNGLKVSLILELMYATGVRVSELIGIKMSNFVLYEGSLLLEIKGKGDKERLIPLTDAATKCLDKYIQIYAIPSNGWLFSGTKTNVHITRQRIGQILKEIVKKSKLNITISPHGIRHSFATHMLEHGANILEIKNLLGHSDVGTTQIYTHVMSSTLRNIVQNHHPLYKTTI